MQLYVAYSKLCRGKLFKRKSKPYTMSGKRHKTNKFANFQTITVRNSPAFNHHVLKPLIFGLWYDAPNPLARTLIIALQVVRTSFGFHLLDFMGSSSPPPTQTTFDTSLFNPVVNSFTYMYFGLKDQRIFARAKTWSDQNFCAILLLELVLNWLLSKQFCIETTGFFKRLCSS